jgi:hypothetical protein
MIRRKLRQDEQDFTGLGQKRIDALGPRARIFGRTTLAGQLRVENSILTILLILSKTVSRFRSNKTLLVNGGSNVCKKSFNSIA